MAASDVASLLRTNFRRDGFPVRPKDEVLHCNHHKYLLTLEHDGKVCIIKRPDNKRIEIAAGIESCVCVQCSSDQSKTVLCSSDGQIIAIHLDKLDDIRKTKVAIQDVIRIVKNVIGLEITLPLSFLSNTTFPWLLSSSYQLIQLGFVVSKNGSIRLAPQQAFTLPFQPETVNCVKSCHDVLCVQNQQNFIDCFSLSSRLLLRHIDLRQTALTGPLTNFSLSPNCGTFSLVSDHRLVVLTFNERQTETRSRTNTSFRAFSRSPISMSTDRPASRSFSKRRVSSTSLSSLDSSSDKSSLNLDLSEYIRGDFDVEDVTCSTLRTCVLCVCYNQPVGETLLVFDHQNYKVYSMRIDDKEKFILSKDVNQPHLVVGHGGLYGIYADYEEQDTVEKWLSDEDCDTSDKLDLPSVLSVQSLEVGLRHKQLDSVALFFSNKENVFTQSTNDDSSKWTNEDVSILGSYVTLTKTTIVDSVKESPAITDEVVQTTLRHLHRLLRHCAMTQHISDADSVMEMNRVIRTISETIVELRGYLKEPEVEKEESVSKEVRRDVVSKWNGLESKDIQEDSVTKNCLPFCQHYLRKTRGTLVRVDDVIHDVGKKVMTMLKQRQVNDACLLIANSGFSVQSTLRDIILLTTDKSLRRCLIQRLGSEKVWTDSELATIRQLDLIENLYSCQSIAKAEEILKEKGKSLLEDPSSLPAVSDLFLTPDRDSSDQESNGNCESANYSRLSLAMVLDWERADVQSVLLERSYSSKDSSRTRLDPSVVWSFLLRRCSSDLLIQWARHQTSTEVTSSWPGLLPVDQNMLDVVNTCPAYLRERLLDIFATQHRFTAQESLDFSLTLHRLSRAVPDVWNCQRSVTSFPASSHQHCGLMIRYLVEKKLVSVLYDFLQIWSQSGHLSGEVLHVLDTLSEDHPWLGLMVSLIDMDQDKLDRDAILDVCEKNVKLLHSKAGVSEGSNLALLAPIIYARYRWTDILNMDSPCDVDRDALKALAAGYPKLYAIYCSGSTPSSHNVYRLGQGEFCVRLMRMRHVNNLPDTPDLIDSMPRELFGVDDGLRVELNTYYLCQGRPAFAYSNFLHHTAQYGPKQTAKLSSVACMKARLLALRSLQSPAVVAACMAYINMLGGDTLSLNVYLRAAYLLHSHRTSLRSKNNANEQVPIPDLVIGCMRRCRHKTETLMAEVTEKIRTELERETPDRSWFDSVVSCHSAMMLSRLHSLPPDTSYLEWCAAQDDWLHFLVVAQLYQYTADKLVPILDKIPNRHLREHLSFVISNVGARTTDQSRTSSLNRQMSQVRRQLIDKVLGERRRETEDSSGSDSEADTEWETETHSDTCRFECPADDNLLTILLNSMSKSSPSNVLLHGAVKLRNPMLALLSACLQTSPRLDCLCCYLLCYVPSTEVLSIRERRCCTEFTLEDLATLTEVCLNRAMFVTLAKAYSTFYPEFGLVYLLKFCVQVRHRNWKQAKIHLDTFMDLVKSSDVSGPYPDLLPPEWTLQLVSLTVKYLLRSLETAEDAHQTTLCLSQAGVNLRLRGRGLPDFEKISRLLQMIRDRGLRVDCRQLMGEASSAYSDQCVGAVRQLIEARLYDEARYFARRAQVDVIGVTVKQITNRMDRLKSTKVWRSELGRLLFWKECDTLFVKYRLPPAVVARIYQEHMTESGSAERVFLCRKTYDWLALTDLASDRHQAQVALWSALIRYEMTNAGDVAGGQSCSELVDTGQEHSKQDLLVYGQVPRKDSPSPLNEEERQGLQSLLRRLLRRGLVMESSQLAAEFCHYSRDLVRVVTCIGLAIGELRVCDLDDELRNGSSTREERSNQSSLQGVQKFIENVPENHPSPEVGSVLSTMLKLWQCCQEGANSCARIITMYTVAQVLYRSYSSVMMDDEMIILRDLLLSSYWNKFDLAKDFITNNSITDSALSQFLCDYVTKLLSKEFGEFDSDLVEKTLQRLLQLSLSPSSLGRQLLESVNARLQVTEIDADLEVEMLIRAHTCFMVSCDMEGISLILRTARKLTARLVAAKLFPQIIRLFVGLARYSEMTYIFDLLRQHQEFLLLFKKDIEQNSHLKMVVLDYLKRYYPSDVDTYNMVALRYSMFREIAQHREIRAKETLRKINAGPLDDTPETVQTLSSIEQCLADAAENYMKDECYRHAHRAIKQARLVALQRQLLSSPFRILSLKQDSLTSFITKHETFMEAYIVAEAYDKRGEWPAALCERVIVHSDWTYLSDFQQIMPVTDELVEKVVSRYKLLLTVNDDIVVNMKRFLRSCTRVKNLYKLATSLQFNDLAQELVNGEAASYLLDEIPVY